MPARKATIEKIRKENRRKYEKLQKKREQIKKNEQSKIANREKTLCKKNMWLHICLGFLILHQTQCSGVVREGQGKGARKGWRDEV